MPLVKRSDDSNKGSTHNDKEVDDAVAAQAARVQNVVDAIGSLTDDQYTDGGVPELNALREATGYTDLTAKERNDAFAIYQG